MKHNAPASLPLKLIAAIGIALTLALPGAGLVTADESNVVTGSSTATNLPGTSTSTSGGVGAAGAATAWNASIPIQHNIQVVAVPGGCSNCTQNATNEANINQTTVASSGDASGSNGGVATTGSAMAGSLAIVHQLNVQVIAGWVPEGGVSQDAANVANINQTTVAGSGSSSADGGGSQASTGNSSALGVSFVSQRNIQIYVGRPSAATAGSIAQNARNEADLDQTTAAVSGDSTATAGSESSTGNVRARALARVRQLQWQDNLGSDD